MRRTSPRRKNIRLTSILKKIVIASELLLIQSLSIKGANHLLSNSMHFKDYNGCCYLDKKLVAFNKSPKCTIKSTLTGYFLSLFVYLILE